MIDSHKYAANHAFTDDLYDVIYAGILKNGSDQTYPTDDVAVKLQSPEKEEFISLFVKLKLQNNESLGTNFMLRVCHKLLSQNKRTVSVLRPDQVCSVANGINPEEFRDVRHNTGSSSSVPFGKVHAGRVPLTATVEGTQTLNFVRELFLNLTRCTEGAEWIKADADARKTIPNLEIMITHVTEIGRLHYVIKDYVNTNRDDFSSVAKALRFDLQKEIDFYYAYTNTWLRKTFDLMEHSNHLVRTTFVPLDHNVLIRLQYLAEVVIAAKGKHGCNLISSVAHTSIREIKSTIMDVITKPVQEMIVYWMANGEIADKYDEFFILDTSADNCWDDGHALSSTNTLDFLNKYQLNDICETGKNMRFLLKAVGPNVNSKIGKLRENIKTALNDEDGFLITLKDRHSRTSTTLYDMRVQSCAVLMEVLINDYGLFLRFKGFRNYMLFGHGDFYTYIVAQLERYFGNDAMHHYQLKDIVESAYSLTSARNDDEQIYRDFKYTVDSTGKINWHSFKFEYVTDEPLDQLFGRCFKRSDNICAFLWRLKKIDWITKKTWNKLNHFGKKSHCINALRPILRNTNTLLSSVFKCSNEIQSFTFGMIDDEWDRFESRLFGAANVKTITDAHMWFLESLTKTVDDGSVSLDAYVKSLHKSMEKFAELFRYFVDTVKSSYRDELIAAEWTNTFMDNLNDIKKGYELELRVVLSKLAVSNTRGLAALASNIDFNGYYGSRD